MESRVGKSSSDHDVEKLGFRPLRYTVKFFRYRPAKMKGDPRDVPTV